MRARRRFEVTLVRTVVDIQTARVVVEGEEEDDAREGAVGNSQDDAVEWEHVRRKHEDVEAEAAKEVPPDTPRKSPWCSLIGCRRRRRALNC